MLTDDEVTARSAYDQLAPAYAGAFPDLGAEAPGDRALIDAFSRRVLGHRGPRSGAVVVRPARLPGMRGLRVLPVLLLLSAMGCGVEEKSQQTPRAGASASPSPSGVATSSGPQVVLYHCGVDPLRYDGVLWEVVEPPFDGTNAPDTFTGFGTFQRDGERLLFTDRGGARLTFTIDDGVPPSPCA